MQPAHANFIEVYRAKNLPQAHMIQIALEDAGIPAKLDGELLQGAVGELPIGWVTAPRILVDASQAAAARALIDHVDAEERDEALAEDFEGSRCLSCGALMPEGDPKCPACGW